MAVSASSRVVDPAHVRLLLEGSVENLVATWNSEVALFPAVSRLHGRTIAGDYEHPAAIRYTINSLLGLAQAARSGTLAVTETHVRAMSETFFARAGNRVTEPADHGLLMVLRCALDAAPAALYSETRRLLDLLGHPPSRLNMQDVSWLLWGAAAAARAGVHSAVDVVRYAYGVIDELTNSSTGLPRHTSQWYRRNVVSFGSLVYYLRAMHEAAQTLGDERARSRFDRGVAHALAFQGPQGEWPWMIDCRTGRPFDFYPVFAVHQDSMAMLFLHPALDRGLEGVEQAIGRSLAWDFGTNELGIQMFEERPFFLYRAIERADRMPKLRRYGRALRARLVSPPAAPRASRVRLNDECRSYHPGWILFVWAGRPEPLATS